MSKPRTALRRLALTLVLVASLLALAGSAAADEYDPKRAGHPLRVAAYILHPVGYLIDRLFLHPMHWLGSREPLRALFGHEQID